MTDTLEGSTGSKKSDSLTSLAGVVILAGGASRRMGSPKAELVLPTGETLLDYHVRQASKLNLPIMIADNDRNFTVSRQLLASHPKLNVTHILDYLPEFNNHFENVSSTDGDKADNSAKSGISKNITNPQGPLVAIESALQAIKKAYNRQTLEHLAYAASLTLNNQQPSWLLVVSCDSLITAPELWQQLQPYTDSAVYGLENKSVICLTDEAHLYPLLGLYHLSLESELRAYIDSGERKVMSFIEPITQEVAVLNQQQTLTNFNTPADFKRACNVLYP